MPSRRRTLTLGFIVLLSAITVLHAATYTAAAPGEAIIRPGTMPLERVPKGWTEPKQVAGEDRMVRCALANKEAVLEVEPWWKSGPRPPEGQYYLIEVGYQDTASKPVVFSAFGNINKYGDRSELHRFGGLNDGKWKTAQIPVGADMIMARPKTNFVEFSILASNDLPVSHINVRTLPKDQVAKAAEKYNAETREWIARVQAARKDQPRNEYSQPQEPVAVATEGGTPIVPYVRSYLQVVYPYSAPQEGEINKTLQVTMAQNEYEPAAVGVYANGRDLTNVRVKVDVLRNPADDRAELKASVRTAEYALVQNGQRRPAARPRPAQSQSAQTQPAETRPAQTQPQASQPAEGAAVATFPQRLWPVYPTQIQRGQSGWFWITFQADPKITPPGLYKGKAIISADQGNAVVEIRVHVLPIQLLDMKQAGLQMGGCISGLLPRHEMETMLRYNHNIINLWLSGVAPTIIPKGKEDFDLDFTLMDDFMAQAKAAGIEANVWFLGGDPYGYPITNTLMRELARQVLGLTVEEYCELIDKDRMNVPPQIAPLYKKWVAKVMQHAKEKNWPEQILTPFDEPAKWVQAAGRKSPSTADNPNVIGTGPWIKPQFEQCCALIHEAAPDARVYGSIHHAEPGLIFLKDVDVFCTNAIHEDAKLGDKVREAGKVFWQYSNFGNGLPDRGRYAFGFFFNAFDSRGSLCWAYNWGPRLDTSTAGASWEYAWYTPLDVIPHPFYEAVREAWDDRRYVETLKKVAKDNQADISTFLAEIAEQGKNLRGEGGRDTVNDFWAASKRIEAMDELRAKVAAKIIEVGKKAGPAEVEPSTP